MTTKQRSYTIRATLLVVAATFSAAIEALEGALDGHRGCAITAITDGKILHTCDGNKHEYEIAITLSVQNGPRHYAIARIEKLITPAGIRIKRLDEIV